MEGRFNVKDKNCEWRERLGRDEIEMIEELAGDTLEEMSYGSEPSPSDFRMIRPDRRSPAAA